MCADVSKDFSLSEEDLDHALKDLAEMAESTKAAYNRNPISDELLASAMNGDFDGD